MAGFSSNSTGLSVVQATNADFSGQAIAGNTIITDNQIWIGSTTPNAGNTHINVKTLTAGTGISFSQNATSFTINGSSGGVSSITGTANQITASAATGAVTLSTPSTFIAPGSIAATTSITATLGNITATSGNLVIPTTSSTIGQLIQNGARIYHTFGTFNTFLGASSGNFTLTTGSAQTNTGLGTQTLLALTTGTKNSCGGGFSGTNIQDGSNNTAWGSNSLQTNVSGNNNCIFGAFSANVLTGTSNNTLGCNTLQAGTSAANNVAIGQSSLNLLLTGARNYCIGLNSGQQYTGSESDNLCYGNAGTTGDNNAIRIGTNGTGTGLQNACFIAGITGVTVTGTAVLCSTAGQLGTIASSIRYKENVEDIPDNVSVMHLKPSQFNYKGISAVSYGLIAEDCDRDFPYLCFYKDDKPESVKYHELPVLLLKEIQRLSERISHLESLK